MMAALRKQHRICPSACAAARVSAASPGTDLGIHRVPRHLAPTRSALERLSSGDPSMVHVWRMCSGAEFAVLRRVSWTLYRSSLRPGNTTTLKCDEAPFRCWNATAFPLHGLTLKLDTSRTHIPMHPVERLRVSASLRALHLRYLRGPQVSTFLELAPLAHLSGLRDLDVQGDIGTVLLGVMALGALKHLERLCLKASPLKELVVPPSVRELDVAVTSDLTCDRPETLVRALPQLAVLSLHVSEFPVSLWSEIVDRGTRLHTLRLHAEYSLSKRGGDIQPKNPRTTALTHLDLAYFDGAGWPCMLLPTLRQLDLRCYAAYYKTPKDSYNPFTQACPAALETCTIDNDLHDDETTLCRTLDCLLAGPSVHSLRSLEISGADNMDVDMSCLEQCSALRRLRVQSISDLPTMPWLTDLAIGGLYTESLHKQVEQLTCNMPGLLVLRISGLAPNPCVHALSQLPRLRHLALRTDTRSHASDCLHLGFCLYGTCPSGDTLHFPSLRLLQVNWEFDADVHWVNQCRVRGITVSAYIPTWSVHGTHDTG